MWKLKVKKLIVLVGTSLLCTVFLAACGGSNSSSNDSEILLWSSTTGPDGEKIQKTVDQYNKTNPDFKVKLVS